jgi:photosystem II stability/assembly factor-like uncharacterized protein
MPYYIRDNDLDLFNLNSDERVFLHKKGRNITVQTEQEYLAGLGAETIWAKYARLATNCNFVWSIAENNNFVFFATETPGRVFRQDKSNSTFSDLGQIGSENKLRAIVCADDNSIVVGSDSGKLYRSIDDGANWNQVLNFGDSCQDSFYKQNNGTLWFGTSGNGKIYSSADNGVSWNLKATLPETAVFCFIERGSDLYAGTHSSACIYKSIDGGNTWNKITNTSAWTIYDFIQADDGKILFSGRPDAGIWKEGNDDAQWNQVFSSTDDEWAYCVEKRNGSLYVGTALRANIYYSPDNGDTWINQGRLGTENKVYSLRVLSDNTLIAGSGDQGWVFRLL